VNEFKLTTNIVQSIENTDWKINDFCHPLFGYVHVHCNEHNKIGLAFESDRVIYLTLEGTMCIKLYTFNLLNTYRIYKALKRKMRKQLSINIKSEVCE
jgi:hypothetical protein